MFTKQIVDIIVHKAADPHVGVTKLHSRQAVDGGRKHARFWRRWH